MPLVAQPVSPSSLRPDPVLTIPTAIGRARNLSSSSGVSRYLSLGFTPDASLHFPPNLPMMPERIHHSPNSPPVHFTNGMHRVRPSFHRPRKYRIRTSHRQHHSHRSPANRLRTKILML